MSISRTAGALGWRATTNWMYASSTDGKAETREDVGSTSVDRKEEEDDMESPLIGLSARWGVAHFLEPVAYILFKDWSAFSDSEQQPCLLSSWSSSSCSSSYTSSTPWARLSLLKSYAPPLEPASTIF